nr:RNA-directed DNA polymerase, eukaryota, reverse transcriptase zinc-binding domain protein [Tanacetum cinerariifolium]
NGEVVIMGDFNEVRYKSDRYGSKFNAHSVMVFNSFILNSALVEEGFAKMVEDGWRDSPCDRSNALRNLTGKLKHLKNRVWNKSKGNNNRDAKAQLKLELEVVDLCIYNGNGTVEDIKRRGEIVNKLQDIDQKRDLEGEVTNDEIKKAVWDCGTDKAPGPDGFTFGFYRKFLYLIDNDVCDAVRFFFKNDNIPNGCNSSFIALIPKISDANMVKDFRLLV